MVEFQSSNGHTILVDDGDAWVTDFAWFVNGRGYPMRTIRFDGRKTTVVLSRELLGLAIGDKRQVDHINRNRLDNRRVNLRVCEKAENAQNRGANQGAHSRYRGVDWSGGSWRARVTVNGKSIFLGRFATEDEANAAAVTCRKEHMPFSYEVAV